MFPRSRPRWQNIFTRSRISPIEKVVVSAGILRILRFLLRVIEVIKHQIHVLFGIILQKFRTIHIFAHFYFYLSRSAYRHWLPSTRWTVAILLLCRVPCLSSRETLILMLHIQRSRFCWCSLQQQLTWVTRLPRILTLLLIEFNGVHLFLIDVFRFYSVIPVLLLVEFLNKSALFAVFQNYLSWSRTCLWWRVILGYVISICLLKLSWSLSTPNLSSISQIFDIRNLIPIILLRLTKAIRVLFLHNLSICFS